MTSANPALSDASPLRRASPWLIAEGVVLVLLAIAAVALPLAAGLAAALVFGWVLILSGVMGLASLWAARGHAHVIWAGLSALIALVVGVLILWRPLAGAVTLALLLAAYLAVDAVALIGMALDQRHRAWRGWPWLIVSGVVDVALVALILAMGPLSDVVLLGFFFGLDLLVAGVALVSLGWMARRAP